MPHIDIIVFGMIANHHAIIKRSINCFNLTKDMKINTIVKTIIMLILIAFIITITIVVSHYNTTCAIIAFIVSFIISSKTIDKLI